MATITEAASGFPSSNGHIPFECGTVAEVLGERGWNSEPVTDGYPGQSPWPFTGGTIRRATVDVGGQAFVDLAAEARMALLRD
jgi:hypothetical protein